MYNLFLFTHVTSLAIWLGSLIAIAVVFMLVRKQFVSGEIRKFFIKLTKIFNGISHLTATLVLISGIVLLTQLNFNENPLYIVLMERGGTLVIILSMILITIFSKKIVKQLTASEVTSTTSLKGSTAYLTSIITTVVLIVAIIFVVSYKVV